MSQVTSQNALVKDSTVQTLNGKLDNLNATLGGNANIAPVFNTATAYSKGDMVNYNGDLYVFTANHSAGAWTGSDAVQTKVSSELSSLKSGLTNLTTLLQITQLSDTATQYQLQGNYSDYMFVAIVLGWYTGASNDNMVIIPSNNWLSNDYLMLYRHNDPSTAAYARIESRGNGYIIALGTEGVSVSVLGLIHK